MYEMYETDSSHTGIHRLSRRYLEPAQDVLILGLALVLFSVMGRTLYVLLRHPQPVGRSHERRLSEGKR